MNDASQETVPAPDWSVAVCHRHPGRLEGVASTDCGVPVYFQGLPAVGLEAIYNFGFCEEVFDAPCQGDGQPSPSPKTHSAPFPFSRLRLAEVDYGPRLGAQVSQQFTNSLYLVEFPVIITESVGGVEELFAWCVVCGERPGGT